MTNILVKDSSGNRRTTNTFILTFKSAAPPQYVKIGYIRIPVSPFVPNPLRYVRCQKFGYAQRNYKGQTICANCGQADYHSNKCHSEAKCPNFSGNHSAFSKTCPKWLLEKRVQQIKTERNCSFIEARKLATLESQVDLPQQHALQLRWWRPRVVLLPQVLVLLTFRQTSRGQINKKNRQLSLPVQSQFLLNPFKQLIRYASHGYRQCR